MKVKATGLTFSKKFFKETAGSVSTITAICMILLLMVMALVVDLGHLYVVQTELQNAADAGASAGAQAIFTLTSHSGIEPVITNCENSKNVARQAVGLNKADGQYLSTLDADVQVGIWAPNAGNGNWEFTESACSNNINAIRVITRKSSAVNGPVNLLFARLFGAGVADLSAQAVALMGWARGIPGGKGTFPLALGVSWVPPPGENATIIFDPTGSNNGCWHSYNYNNCSTSQIIDLINGTTPTPPVNIGDSLKVSTGDHTAVIQEIKRQFDNVYHGDWVLILPVVSDAGNFVGSLTVLGFCALKITQVNTAPEKTITGVTVGGYIVPEAATGGPNYGLRAALPKLVQ